MIQKKFLLASLCSAMFVVGCNQAADTAPTVPAPAQTSAAADQAAETPMDENTLLTVNGQAVSKEMYGLYFQDRMRSVPDAKNSPQMQMGVLNELSNVLIVAQDAMSKGIDKRPEIKATMELLKAKLLTQTLIQEYAKEHQPSEDQIKTFYEAEYAHQSNMEYKARHILVKDEEKAKSLIAELDKGADFADLAKKNSTGPTGKNGGDLGWFDATQMVKPFADAVVSMEKGTYTKEPVKTQFGWHVIMLEDTRKTEPPSLEGVRGEIITKLQQKSLAEFMADLRNKSKVVFNEKNLAKDKPADTTAESADAKPAEQTDGGAQEEKPAEDKPAEDKPTEEKPAEEKPASE
jgi:peptidyl-prolyl cis-trans isomerase C